MQECLTTWIPTLRNWADLLTKVMSGTKRRELVKGVLYDIYDYDQEFQDARPHPRFECDLEGTVEMYPNTDHQDATGTGSYPCLNSEMMNIGAIYGPED